jgi:hypothetical protein
MENFFRRKSYLWPSGKSSTIRALDECRNIKLGLLLEGKKKVFGIDLEMLPNDPSLRSKNGRLSSSDRAWFVGWHNS